MAFKRSAVRSRLSPPHLSRASNGARETKATEYGGIAQLGERLNGIQEVSGSIPLISTTSPENHWFSGLFLVVIVNSPCIIRIFRTGALRPGLRYSPYRNRTGITTVPGGPIRPNPGLFPRKRHWKTSQLPPISPAPERADSALSCPHRRVPRCSEW